MMMGGEGRCATRSEVKKTAKTSRTELTSKTDVDAQERNYQIRVLYDKRKGRCVRERQERM